MEEEAVYQQLDQECAKDGRWYRLSCEVLPKPLEEDGAWTMSKGEGRAEGMQRSAMAMTGLAVLTTSTV